MNEDETLKQLLVKVCENLAVVKDELQSLGEILGQRIKKIEINSDKDEEKEVVCNPEAVADKVPNYNEMSKTELKELCRSQNLKVSGTTWDLMTRLVANYSTQAPPLPPGACFGYHLKSLERMSNTHKVWLSKCHSGKNMQIKLYLCYSDTSKEKAFLVAVCECGKECLRAWPLSISGNDGGCSLTFEVLDTSASWSSYNCQYKAEFQSQEIAKQFKRIFIRYSRKDLINEDNTDSDEMFQSQRLF
jgi:hypothetical protein